MKTYRFFPLPRHIAYLKTIKEYKYLLCRNRDVYTLLKAQRIVFENIKVVGELRRERPKCLFLRSNF